MFNVPSRASPSTARRQEPPPDRGARERVAVARGRDRATNGLLVRAAWWRRVASRAAGSAKVPASYQSGTRRGRLPFVVGDRTGRCGRGVADESIPPMVNRPRPAACQPPNLTHRQKPAPYDKRAVDRCRPGHRFKAGAFARPPEITGPAVCRVP